MTLLHAGHAVTGDTELIVAIVLAITIGLLLLLLPVRAPHRRGEGRESSSSIRLASRNRRGSPTH